MLAFRTLTKSTECGARAGVMDTAHGPVNTPVFMPVGTLGTVKALTPEDLTENGAQIILGNTYHLYLRPGCEVIQLFSGLHRFMNWQGPILTDSGGFQVFSLARLSKLSEDGYAFQSHIDGSAHLLTPETSIAVQLCLGADIVMCLDQCLAFPADRAAAESAMGLTTRWAGRSKRAFDLQVAGQRAGTPPALFGIVQGGMHHDLRGRSVEALVGLGFDGYALGGLSVGEPKEQMMAVAAHTLPRMPTDRPRYVMGVGTPEDLVNLVALGADMFDCVMPTRNARNGQLFTDTGTLNIANARHRTDTAPVQAGCGCYTCRNFSLAYLRHLYLARELLAYRLNTIHNIHYYLDLMAQARASILEGRFETFQRAFFDKRGLPAIQH